MGFLTISPRLSGSHALQTYLILSGCERVGTFIEECFWPQAGPKDRSYFKTGHVFRHAWELKPHQFHSGHCNVMKLGRRNPKKILLTRDPRNRLVSAWRGFCRRHNSDITLRRFLETSLHDGSVPFSDAKIERWKEQPNVFHITFEDLLTNPQQRKHMMTFLGLPFPDPEFIGVDSGKIIYHYTGELSDYREHLHPADEKAFWRKWALAQKL